MATPVGHSLAAYAVYKFFAAAKGPKAHRLFVLSVFAANAPDLDFLPGLFLGQPALYHHGITHSLSWAIGVGLLMAGLLYFRGESFRRIFSLCFLAYLSHLLIDMLGPDRRPPHGIPFFWPFSRVYLISPVSLFLGMHHGTSGHASIWEWFEGMLSFYNLGAIAIEVAWLAPFVIVLSRRR